MIVLFLLVLLFAFVSVVLYLRMRRRDKEQARRWADRQIALLKIVMLLVFAVGFTQVQPFYGETLLVNAVFGALCVAGAALLYWRHWTQRGQRRRASGRKGE